MAYIDSLFIHKVISSLSALLHTQYMLFRAY